ncbi:GCN5-related N-acetyltransferas-like protein, partial [Dothidotthia symphoricarpi CBS 119687]
MQSNGATIRYATREDVPAILSLIKELAAYEKASSSVEATESTLLQTLSFPQPTSSPTQFTPGFAKTLLVTAPDGSTCAMALFCYNYSTWTGPGVYLEDLFVQPDYRGRGYGTMLLAQLARETKMVGGKRLEWSCLDWNTRSLAFYEGGKVGAKRKTEWLGLRVEGEALEKLAGE